MSTPAGPRESLPNPSEERHAVMNAVGQARTLALVQAEVRLAHGPGDWKRMVELALDGHHRIGTLPNSPLSDDSVERIMVASMRALRSHPEVPTRTLRIAGEIRELLRHRGLRPFRLPEEGPIDFELRPYANQAAPSSSSSPRDDPMEQIVRLCISMTTAEEADALLGQAISLAADTDPLNSTWAWLELAHRYTLLRSSSAGDVRRRAVTSIEQNPYLYGLKPLDRRRRLLRIALGGQDETMVGQLLTAICEDIADAEAITGVPFEPRIRSFVHDFVVLPDERLINGALTWVLRLGHASLSER